MDTVKIEVIGWEKYNPRKDYKKPWWFALSNRFLEDSQFYHFKPEEKLAWIYILSQASQQSKSEITLVIEHAERVCGIQKKFLLSAILKLEELGCTRSVQNPNAICTESVRHITEQNKQNRTNNNAHSDEFADFYSKYPKKKGKAPGKKAYLRLRKSGVLPETVLLAMEKFVAHHKAEGTESKFIPYPATFLNDLETWCDPDAGSSEDFSNQNVGVSEAERALFREAK